MAETTQVEVAPAAEVEAAEPAVAETEDLAIAGVAAIDEDALLEAMIREDDEAKQEADETAETISVDDLATITLDDAVEEVEERRRRNSSRVA